MTLGEASFFASAAKHIERRLVERRPLELQRNRTLKLVSRPGEAPEAFAERCDAAAQERADAETAKIRDRLEAKRDRLDRALELAQRRVEELDTDTRTAPGERARRRSPVLCSARSSAAGGAPARSRARSAVRRRDGA